MLVTFSPAIPSEAASNDEIFSPFKTFLIETNDNIIAKKFEKHKSKRKIDFPVPECYICGMHFNAYSQFKKKEEAWICSFCNKENLHNNLTQLKKLKSKKYYLKKDFSETQNDLIESLLPSPKTLIIMVVDFGILMEDLQFSSSPSEIFGLKEWLTYLIERDLPKYPTQAKFLLILCNSKLMVLNNDSETEAPIVFENLDHDDPVSCFNWGKSKAHDFLIGNTNKPKYLLRKLKKKKYKTHSSIGAGLALALGVIQTIQPTDHRIVVLGQGYVGFGACRNVDNEENREKECRQELKRLYEMCENPNEINIQVIDCDEKTEKNSFFTSLNEVFRKAETFTTNNESKGNKIRDFDILPIDESEKNEWTLRIASSQNIVILPYDTLTHDKATYCFQEKRGVQIMRKVDPIRCLYPFHFEFKAGKSAGEEKEILLQVELRVKKENLINVYVTTKSLQILKNKKSLDFSLLNFTVSTYCYYANGFFNDKEKVQGLQKLVNEYVTALKGKYPTPSIILSMKKYIEDKINGKFEIQIHAKDKKEPWLNTFVKNNNDSIDFKKIERLSEKKH